METRRRTLLKSISYRIIGGLITLGVAYVATERVGAAVAIGLVDTCIKMGAFYFHERLWLQIAYGRTTGSEYDI